MSAAAARKLQKDIEVALKKVEDGIEEFTNVWDQATTSSAGPQKDRLGEELKKSINKLQRLRVQIREWLGQSDVKNNFKEKLEEARKRIESDMKRFKEFERDMKTKAFSACALAKGGDDDEDDEKRKSQEWLVEILQQFNEQLEGFEADTEALTNKKSLTNDDKDRMAQMKTYTERHQWHMKNVELLLRGLDNDAVDFADLNVVKESLEVYFDMLEDPDYPHDETLYDCFDLHEYEAQVAKPRTEEAANQDGETPSNKDEPKAKMKEKEKKDKLKKDKKKDEKKGATTPQNASGGASNKSGAGSTKNADGKALTPAGGLEVPEVLNIFGQNTSDECKVQSDQLLLGGEAEEFVCKICQTHVVGCGPTLTNCSHLFCGDCLGQWFNAHPDSQSWAQRAKAAGPDRVVPCPVCKQPLNTKRDLYPVCGATSRSENLLLWRMLSSLKIMCINHTRMSSTGKCDWIGEYGQYQKHIKACEIIQEGGVPPATPVSAPSPVAAPVRAPVETRRPDIPEPKVEVEKPVAVVAAPPAPAAKLPAAKPEHLPKALGLQGSPAGAQAQQAPAARMVAAKAQPPAPAPEVKPASSFLLPDEPRADLFVPPAPVKIHQIQQAPVVAAPQQSAASVYSSPAQPQAQAVSRKAAAPSQEAADGSFTTHATSAFEPTGPNMVTCMIGDTILVLEKHNSGWTYCKNLSAGGNSNTGWAPSWIIQPTPADEANGRKAAAARKEHEAPAAAPVLATAAAAPAPAPVAPATSFVAQQKSQDSSLLAGQQATNKVDMHRSAQPSVAAAPTPQHGIVPSAVQAAPLAPKAPSTMVRVATAGFAGTSPSQLCVNAGDLVEIVESHASGWTYGRKVHAQAHAASAVEGWFPDWVCAQK